MDKWFNNSNVIRIVAVLLGVLLWVIVRLDVESSSSGTQPSFASQKYTDVSISVIGLDGNRYTVEKVDPQKVNLQVNGTASALRRVNISDYKVVLDLSGVGPGEQLVELKAVGFPSGVDVDINPPNVFVTLEEKLRKEIPVTVNVTGTPAAGYHAGDPVVQPNRVNVTVSGSEAQEIMSVVGELSVQDATETVKSQVKLVALDGEGAPVDVAISPPVVDVEVPITSPFKTVPLQIKLKGNAPAGFAVGAFEQSVSEVTVYGSQAYLNSLEFYDGLFIDLSKLSKTTDFEFEIPLKEGVEQVNPTSVTARVTVVDAVTTTLNNIELNLNGKSEEYNYQIISPTDTTFNVSVEAAPDIVANLTNNDVKAFVNVSNLPPGAHELPVEYNLPSFVKTAPGNINYVTILIEAKNTEESTAPEGNGTSGGDKTVKPQQGGEPSQPADSQDQPAGTEEPNQEAVDVNKTGSEGTASDTVSSVKSGTSDMN